MNLAEQLEVALAGYIAEVNHPICARLIDDILNPVLKSPIDQPLPTSRRDDSECETDDSDNYPHLTRDQLDRDLEDFKFVSSIIRGSCDLLDTELAVKLLEKVQVRRY
jgi:hypothetical protein